MPSVPKAKQGHSNHVGHQVLILRISSTWVQLNYPPWLGPQDTKLCAPSVPKVKLTCWDRMCHRSQRQSQDTLTKCAISPKGEARTHGPSEPSFPKVKLGHSDHRHHVLEFCTYFFWGGVLQGGNQDSTILLNIDSIVLIFIAHDFSYYESNTVSISKKT